MLFFHRAKEFFKRTSHVRIAAIGAFLISIPIFFTGKLPFIFLSLILEFIFYNILIIFFLLFFLSSPPCPTWHTGVILFNFVNFDDTPALATSIVIGLGIIFCGVACVQTVYLWQMEKTKASQEVNSVRLSQNTSVIPIPLELSTLV